MRMTRNPAKVNSQIRIPRLAKDDEQIPDNIPP
jgi:hypothetical protein